MTQPRHVTLLTRKSCHLCEDARDVVLRASAATGASWSETDVDSDPELRAEYGDRVPVVLVDGVEYAHFTVDETALRGALTGPVGNGPHEGDRVPAATSPSPVPPSGTTIPKAFL